MKVKNLPRESQIRKHEMKKRRSSGRPNRHKNPSQTAKRAHRQK